MTFVEGRKEAREGGRKIGEERREKGRMGGREEGKQGQSVPNRLKESQGMMLPYNTYYSAPSFREMVLIPNKCLRVLSKPV